MYVDDLPDATEANKKQIKGEALALRALIHFDLVRIFAQTYVGNGSALGVPYVEMVHPSSYQPARDDVNTVYTKILTDLDAAISLLAGGPAGRVPFHFTQVAVRALKARVVLTMGNYPEAKILAEGVINNTTPRFSLISNENYAASWLALFTSESIFALAHTSKDYSATNALGYIYLQAGYGDLRVPPAFKALFADDDVRQCFFMPGTGTQTSYTFIRKYPGRENITGLDNYNMIRLSEMYLIAAEAAARTGDETAAQGYLNAVRQRALPNAAPATETGQDLIDAILLEKRKELCYEGHYFFDLKRLRLTINSAINPANLNPYKTITYPDNLLAYPIPQRELDANRNMVQNPY
jgi:hypothetical protein